MGVNCPACGERFKHEVRYCSECGVEVDADAELGSNTSKQSFWKRHQTKVVVVALFLTAIVVLPMLASGAAPGALVGFTAGAFAAALAVAYVAVFVGVKMFDGASGQAPSLK